MPGVLRYVLRRSVQAAVTILVIVVLNFTLLHAVPGDIVDVLAGETGAIDPAHLEELRARFGLDQPFVVQLGHYLSRVLTFDLGFSFRHNRDVAGLIAERLPATLLLMGAAIAIACGLGLLLGVTAARYVNTPIDNVVSVLSLLCYATPVFWIGLMMIVLFSVELRWLPSSGMATIGADLRGLAYALDVARHMVMPTVALSLFYIALYTRIVRATMLEVLRLDYVRAARAKGLSPRRAAFAHAVPNAVLPMVTMAGVQIGHLLGGAILVETVFGWPGIGRLAFEAVFQRDFNLLLGVLLLSTVLVLVVNLLVDLAYAWLDPRIELG